MIKIYFGRDKRLNQAIKSRLDKYQLEYQEFISKDIDDRILMDMIGRMTDMFDLLDPKMNRYKLDNRLSMSQFISKIVTNQENYLRLPIAVVESKGVFPGLVPEEVGTFLPKGYRKAERINFYMYLEEKDEGRRFWENFESIRRQAELPWFELNKLLFMEFSNDLGESKKAKDRFFAYKHNHQIPPEEIIEKIENIFLINREDLIKKKQ